MSDKGGIVDKTTSLPMGTAGQRYPIVQVSLAVKDLDAGMEAFHQAFGWAPWQVSDHTPPAFHDTQYRGQRVHATLRGAEVWVGGMCFELLEPLEGPSLWSDCIAARGEGIVSIAFLFDRREDADRVEREFAGQFGIQPIWREEIGDNVRFYYLDSADQFGCYIEGASVEPLPDGGADGGGGEVYPPGSSAQGPSPVSGIWYPQITQLTLTVRNLDAAVKAYHQAFGWGPWRFFESTDREPLLGSCELDGRPVEPFRLRWAEAAAGDAVIFQIVEPVGGPNPWQEQLDTVGEGLTSISLAFDSQDDANRAEAAFASMGISVRARARVGGQVEWCYLDTMRDFKCLIGLGFGRAFDAVTPLRTYP